MKSAFVSIIGRPSAGKSTFLNTVVGNKVSIVAKIPQTTRNKIRGIVNRKQGQLVFIDTPGYHVSEKKFNLYMTDLVNDSMHDVDMVLYMVDLHRGFGPEEEHILEMIKKYKGPKAVGLNKIDLAPGKLDEAKQFLAEHLPDAPIVGISAQGETNTEEMLNALYEIAPEGEPMYPEEFYTDQDPVFRIQELIREKAINLTSQEIPHAMYVDIEEMEAVEKKSLLRIRAFIIVERESQQGIVVGKGGIKIKKIREQAQDDIKKLFPYKKVYLDLRVKTKKKWRTKDDLIKKLTNY